MNAPIHDLPDGWWANNIEEIDREIARLATLCRVRILEPGAIERVLHKDPSVCGTFNEMAFAKLHDLVMLHFAVREKSAKAVGQTRTAQIEYYVIGRLNKAYPDLAADWRPA